MRFNFNPVSLNQKVGPIPVTVTSSDSCPNSCPLKDKGCYAKQGPVRWKWNRVDKGGISEEEFLEKITALPNNTLWRHNEAGDLPGIDDKIDKEFLQKLINANLGKRGFTYTHRHDFEAVKHANESGFVVNLSANNLNHADELYDFGPTTVILPINQLTNTTTPEGRKVVICPAVTHENVTCSSCKLCANNKRSCIVGFPAHGASKKHVEKIANDN